MKRIFVVPLAILLLVALILGSCAKPAPAPAPTPAPSPAPTPAPKPTPAPPTEKEWVPPVPGMKPGEEDKYFTWTYAESSARPKPPPGFESDPRENFFNELEKRTQGRFKVKYAWGGIIGAPAEILAMVGAGVVEMGMTAGQPAAEFALTSPQGMGGFLTGDIATDEKIYHYCRTHPICTAQLTKQNLVYGWSMPFGANMPLFREGIKRMETVEDFKGLQFGSTPGALHLWARELGMVPVTIAIFDYYEGMQKGMIDVCALNYAALHLIFRLDEVMGSCVEVYPQGVSATPGYINKDSWDGLPQYIKDLWWEVYPTYFQEYNTRTRDSAAELTKGVLREKGVDMYKLPPAEEDKVHAAAAPVWKEWAEEQARYTSKELTTQYLKDIIAYRDKIVGKPFTVYTP